MIKRLLIISFNYPRYPLLTIDNKIYLITMYMDDAMDDVGAICSGSVTGIAVFDGSVGWWVLWWVLKVLN